MVFIVPAALKRGCPGRHYQVYHILTMTELEIENLIYGPYTIDNIRDYVVGVVVGLGKAIDVLEEVDQFLKTLEKMLPEAREFMKQTPYEPAY